LFVKRLLRFQWMKIPNIVLNSIVRLFITKLQNNKEKDQVKKMEQVKNLINIMHNKVNNIKEIKEENH
jgi:hypothetical protein